MPRKQHVNKMKFKGSHYGVHKFKRYKNPDILNSKLLGKTFNKNEFSLSKKKQKRNFFMYHVWDSTKLAEIGRWYDISFNLKTGAKINKSQKTLEYIILEYDQMDGTTLYDVPVKIKFTKSGFEKLQKMIGK